MKNKLKKCIGTGKAKGHGCRKEYYKRTFGICDGCLIEWAMTTEDGKVWLRKQTAYKMASNKKEERKTFRKEKDAIVNWRAKLQTKAQEIVRLIDIGLPCLARGYHPNQMHGGHIYARGGNATIGLNLHNIHRQSAQSNFTQNDDGLLREGLVKEYGQNYGYFISELRQTPSLSYSNIEYKEFYKKACKISLELKREGKIYNLKERINMRNKINKELGIYDNKFCLFNYKNN